MSTLMLSSDENTVYWTISGLTAENYADLGISRFEVSSGSPPASILDSTGRFANTSGSKSGSFSYDNGTYTFYGFAKTYDGEYWPAGCATVDIKGKPKFSWDYDKYPGSNMITAYEWNNLIYYIQEKTGGYTPPVTKGDPLTAENYNAIIDLLGASSYYKVKKGDLIYASQINRLVTYANVL